MGNQQKEIRIGARVNGEFSTCPFQTLAPYIIDTKKSGGANNGGHIASIVDKTLIRAYHHFVGGIPLMTWDFLKNVFAQVWNERLAAHQKKPVKKILTEEDREICLQCLEHYFDRYLAAPRDRVEQSTNVCPASNIFPKLHYKGIDYLLTGSWDRLDYSFELDGLVIIEYKVKTTDLGQKEIDSTFESYKGKMGSIQLGQYAYILSILKPDIKVKLCRLILITPAGIYEQEWIGEKVEALKKQAALSAQKRIEIESSHLDNPYKFECKRNAFCGKCKVKEYCLSWCNDNKIAALPIPASYFQNIKEKQERYKCAKNNSQYEQLDLLGLLENKQENKAC